MTLFTRKKWVIKPNKQTKPKQTKNPQTHPNKETNRTHPKTPQKHKKENYQKLKNRIDQMKKR